MASNCDYKGGFLAKTDDFLSPESSQRPLPTRHATWADIESLTEAQGHKEINWNINQTQFPTSFVLPCFGENNR
ncbi:MAG TPA: hypothetical protein ENN02_02065 [Halothiobacillus sp.]|nr:hypothetical protein [Halothiobacillus sp.]